MTLVERAGTVMPLQSRSQSRWLDPVQYDWPASHWREQAWPIDENPRRFTAVAATFPVLRAAVAEDWASNFESRASPVLGKGVTVLFHTEALAWTVAPTGVVIDLHDAKTATTSPIDADVLILAAGFGTEDSAVPDASNPGTKFRGVDFWADDQFESATMGIATNRHGVLVSGSGDGALQDFVRLSVGVRAVGDVLDAVWNSTTALTPWKEQMLGLWHWEDHAVRARGFSPSPLDECILLRRLHTRHHEAVEALFGSPQWQAVQRWFDAKISRRNFGSVQLALRCDHFHWCYALNRTGALIAIKYFQSKGFDPILANVALKSTAPLAHSCSAGCWGHAHEAHLAQGVTCADDASAIHAWPAAQTTSGQYDGLVIRHGIDPLTYGPRTFDRLKPQIIPFHLP
ncbi:hypothetical protein DES41_11315 [Pseudorhodoferax soli]|uniref:FAD/NAD(P)-binding domain-containing protein n=1 Tax=Pseudorhodoferax soli TaxID=545864 RepID=A0A368XAU8_9BURK|nr:hypothetical protein DES41_11315 [Pseudorhodoferax soli]